MKWARYSTGPIPFILIIRKLKFALYFFGGRSFCHKIFPTFSCVHFFGAHIKNCLILMCALLYFSGLISSVFNGFYGCIQKTCFVKHIQHSVAVADQLSGFDAVDILCRIQTDFFKQRWRRSFLQHFPQSC